MTAMPQDRRELAPVTPEAWATLDEAGRRAVLVTRYAVVDAELDRREAAARREAARDNLRDVALARPRCTYPGCARFTSAERCPTHDVDEVAIERAMRGERVKLTDLERTLAITWLADQGMPPSTIRRTVGTSDQIVADVLARSA